MADRTLSSLEKTERLLDSRIGKGLLGDRGVALAIAKRHPQLIKRFSSEVKDDKAVAMAAAKVDGNSLAFFSERLRSDEDVAMATLKSWGTVQAIYGVGSLNGSSKHFGSNLLNDRKFAARATKHLVDLRFFSETVRRAPEVWLTLFSVTSKNSLEKSGCHIPFELSNNEAFMSKAVEKHPELAKFASSKVRDSEEFADAALRSDGKSFGLLSERLRGMKRLAMKAVKTAPMELENASEEIRDDEGVVARATELNAKAIRYASERLRDDYEMARIALKKDKSSISLLSSRIKGELGMANPLGELRRMDEIRASAAKMKRTLPKKHVESSTAKRHKI